MLIIDTVVILVSIAQLMAAKSIVENYLQFANSLPLTYHYAGGPGTRFYAECPDACDIEIVLSNNATGGTRSAKAIKGTRVALAIDSHEFLGMVTIQSTAGDSYPFRYAVLTTWNATQGNTIQLAQSEVMWVPISSDVRHSTVREYWRMRAMSDGEVTLMGIKAQVVAEKVDVMNEVDHIRNWRVTAGDDVFLPFCFYEDNPLILDATRDFGFVVVARSGVEVQVGTVPMPYTVRLTDTQIYLNDYIALSVGTDIVNKEGNFIEITGLQGDIPFAYAQWISSCSWTALSESSTGFRDIPFPSPSTGFAIPLALENVGRFLILSLLHVARVPTSAFVKVVPAAHVKPCPRASGPGAVCLPSTGNISCTLHYYGDTCSEINATELRADVHTVAKFYLGSSSSGIRLRFPVYTITVPRNHTITFRTTGTTAFLKRGSLPSSLRLLGGILAGEKNYLKGSTFESVLLSDYTNDQEYCGPWITGRVIYLLPILGCESMASCFGPLSNSIGVSDLSFGITATFSEFDVNNVLEANEVSFLRTTSPSFNAFVKPNEMYLFTICFSNSDRSYHSLGVSVDVCCGEICVDLNNSTRQCLSATGTDAVDGHKTIMFPLSQIFMPHQVWNSTVTITSRGATQAVGVLTLQGISKGRNITTWPYNYGLGYQGQTEIASVTTSGTKASDEVSVVVNAIDVEQSPTPTEYSYVVLKRLVNPNDTLLCSTMLLCGALRNPSISVFTTYTTTYTDEDFNEGDNGKTFEYSYFMVSTVNPAVFNSSGYLPAQRVLKWEAKANKGIWSWLTWVLIGSGIVSVITCVAGWLFRKYRKTKKQDKKNLARRNSPKTSPKLQQSPLINEGLL